jgi:RES domain-containing protein
VRAFRIALAKYGASARDVFSGLSGYSTDGRWHSRGRYLDYAAESQSLAILERLVHYKRFDNLQPHVLCSLEIPDRAIVDLASVPPGWDGIDPLPAAQALGNEWYDRSASPGIRVPSVVTRGEFNLLVNARHSAWRWAWVSGPVPLAFDGRLEELMACSRRRKSAG